MKIWIGTVVTGKENYQNYFKLDYKSDGFDDPNYKICDFCKEIGTVWYDEDFIGRTPIFDEIVDIDTLISQTPLNSSNRKQLKNDCFKMGVKNGNAVLFYSGETREMTPGEKFNGLVYIGNYNM